MPNPVLFTPQSRVQQRAQEGFTLIELVAVIVILGIVAVAVVERWLSLNEDAELAQAEAVGASIKAGFEQVMLSARVQSVQDTSTNIIVNIEEIPVRFRFGFPRNTDNANHLPDDVVPKVTGAAGERLFYLFLQAPYPTQYISGAQPTGWEHRNNGCRPGAPNWLPERPPGGSGMAYRCWEYKLNDESVYLVTYSANQGTFYYGQYP